jgi:hypothetical protein
MTGLTGMPLPFETPYDRIARRHFISLLLASLSARAWSQTSEPAGRELDLSIADGFGGASAADIKAVLRSAAEALWKHCPNTRWEVPGFYIYPSSDYPICINDHRPDGRIAIGLTTKGNHWSQFAFQFAHEFCHALAGHSNDWKKAWIKGCKANHWIEESLCETASLFALRAMGRTWPVAPPYPNWKGYAAALTKYAQDRLDKSAQDLPAGKTFAEWFRENEAALRLKGSLREKNNVVAMQLLPLFEARPSGWEAVTFYNLGPRDPEKSLAAHFADWSAIAPLAQKEFIQQLAAVFRVKQP